MELNVLVEAIVESVSNLDEKKLANIDAEATYSNDDKEQITEEFAKIFKRFRDLGIKKLIAHHSECKYCYPGSKAFSFFNADTEEFIIRFVIHQVNNLTFKVEECKNNPILTEGDGLPF